MVFSWDPAKEEANWRKHGIHFAVAVSIFNDPHCVYERNRLVDEEWRWHAIGAMDAGKLLLVVHTLHGDTEQDVRIISAREATTHEKRIYESGAL